MPSYYIFQEVENETSTQSDNNYVTEFNAANPNPLTAAVYGLFHSTTITPPTRNRSWDSKPAPPDRNSGVPPLEPEKQS